MKLVMFVANDTGSRLKRAVVAGQSYFASPKISLIPYNYMPYM